MIVLDYQPLSIVEDVGFKILVNKLNKKYTLPSRRTLSEKLLPRYYMRIKQELQNSLHQVEYISVTCDYWKGQNNRTYLSMTGHFILDFSLQSKTLATVEVKISHTGTNTAAAITEVCNEFDILSKVVTVVTDSAANMKKAINDDLQKHHHPCVAHTVNLTVNDAIASVEGLKELLLKCRTIVTHFKQSSVASYKLKEKQGELNLTELVLKQDIVTRWNSTYIMLERLLTLRQPICLALMELDRAPENLSADDWTVIKDVLPILQPFLQLTEELSGDKYVTMSTIVPLIRGLRLAIREASPISFIGQSLQISCVDYVTRRLGSIESNKIVAKATFLDPRFKKAAFGQDDNARNAQQWVTEELTSLLARHNEEGATVDTERTHSSFRVPNREMSLWSFFDERASEQRPTPIATAIVMLRQYMETPLFNRKKDPMEYWRDHERTFPELYKMAKKYLCIPATSVPSERLFSKAGYVLSERRNRLSSDKMNEIIFLNHNIETQKK
ncbi:E3 SUMO-protein ligase ZBED1 [Plutella xylostella]|uniref:E3 SUMO-protein ligase ZBED1 n=1 Tax=Plutella xylostella TaxID=51655 RepID=UPI0018D0BB03|nr:E3 SUMO-protein ligase ZBED1 [Plutella xylostella]